MWGSNLQNIEKSLRAIYISDGWNKPDIGKLKYWLMSGDLSVFSEEELFRIRSLAQADQSGAEALIVAYLCKPGQYRELFIHNVKPHVYVAMKLFKEIWPAKMKELNGSDIDIDLLDVTPIASLKLNPEWKSVDKIIKDSDNWSLTERYYYLAKQTVHSSNYGIMPPTFRMNVLEKSGGKIVISKPESERFLMTYRGLFPEIPEWNEDVRRLVDKYKRLYNLHGFPYNITDEDILDTKYKEYIAWVPQSTVAEITRKAYYNLQEYIEAENKPWDVLLDGHDSILTQGPLVDTKERIAKMQEVINQEFESPVDGAKFRMKSEAQVGFNWGPYKEEINELGLRELEWK